MTSEDKEMPEAKPLKGRAKGGAALAASMTPEEKKARALKGSEARWGLKATHRGNFKDEFGIDAACYVLNDKLKTAVISQIDIGALFGLSRRGNAFPRFLASQAMHGVLGAELEEKLRNPIVFQWLTPGAGQPLKLTIHGTDVSVVIDLCRAILRADGERRLKSHQKDVARQAGLIIGASAKAGMQGLVYALAGYDRTKEEVIEAYKMYVREEAREYEREFSPELYEQWYRLYGLAKPERGRPWEFRYLTIDHIYKPLARSNGLVFEMAKTTKGSNGEKNDKIHQFLSEVGVKALRTQVGMITGIATVSPTRSEYEKHIAEKIHGQRSLPFDS